MAQRLPKRIVLPFGNIIIVKLVPPTHEALHNPECPEDDLDGCWVETEKTIYINNTLSPKRARYLLWHELFHSIVDIGHNLFLEKKIKSTGDV